MNEESLRILKMIEDGKITAEEGKKILDAMNEEDAAQPAKTAAPQRKKKILRVVVDGTGHEKVRVNIPLEIAKKLAGLTALVPNEAKKEMLDNGIDIDAINLEELIGMFQEGLIDENLVDIEDSGKGISVKVYVD